MKKLTTKELNAIKGGTQREFGREDRILIDYWNWVEPPKE